MSKHYFLVCHKYYNTVIRFNLMDEFTLDNLFRCFDMKHRGFLTDEDFVLAMGMLLSDEMEIKMRLCFQVIIFFSVN